MVCLVIFITRSGYKTVQKANISIRYEGLEWITIMVSQRYEILTPHEIQHCYQQ